MQIHKKPNRRIKKLLRKFAEDLRLGKAIHIMLTEANPLRREVIKEEKRLCSTGKKSWRDYNEAL